MPFQFSCFISYRHIEFAFERSNVQKILTALKGQLAMSAPLPVYLDEDRLKGGQFYNEALAQDLCKSSCMVMLYWPNYFSIDHTFCSREYKLMEALEAERLKRMPEAEQRNGLIVVIALADFDKIPAEIRQSRLCYDFEPYLLSRNLTKHPNFMADMRNIRRYIAERCEAAIAFPPPDPCQGCGTCALPATEAILPWIYGVRHPGVPYPTRQPGM